MTLELVTPAADLAVSLFEVKDYLGITHDEFDVSTIRPLIERATAHVEDQLAVQLITATWKLHRDCFPTGRGEIELERPPVITVSQIDYTDTDGAPQTVASSQLDAISKPGRLLPAVAATWPATQSQKVNAVAVTFTAGYGTEPADVPRNIQQAILLLVGHWFHNREAVGAVGDEIALGFQALLWDERWK